MKKLITYTPYVNHMKYLPFKLSKTNIKKIGNLFMQI